MGSYRRAALAGMEERGQVLEVDLPQVQRQEDSTRITPTPERYKAQEVSRLPHAGGQAVAQALCACLSLGLCWDGRLHGYVNLAYLVKNWSSFFSWDAEQTWATRTRWNMIRPRVK